MLSAVGEKALSLKLKLHRYQQTYFVEEFFTIFAQVSSFIVSRRVFLEQHFFPLHNSDKQNVPTLVSSRVVCLWQSRFSSIGTCQRWCFSKTIGVLYFEYVSSNVRDRFHVVFLMPRGSQHASESLYPLFSHLQSVTASIISISFRLVSQMFLTLPPSISVVRRIYLSMKNLATLS